MAKIFYRDDNVLVINGDCLEVLPKLSRKFKAVITDPPYGIDFQSARRSDATKRLPKIANDKKPFTPFIPLLKNIILPDGCAYVFSRWDVQQEFINVMTEADLKPQNCLIWDKVIHGMGDLKRAYGSRYESILFHAEKDFRFQNKRPTDIIRVQRVTADKLKHGNEKPVELLCQLMEQSTAQGDYVLDCFSGSGSTAIAALKSGRKVVAVELEEKYCQITVDRIKEYYGGLK